jgi:glycogen synthase kinase 3 beta
MYQVFRGLAYLHHLGFAHRDVKLRNILFNSQTGVTKLCDLGSAKLIAGGQTTVTYTCTRRYRAPELLCMAPTYTYAIGTCRARVQGQHRVANLQLAGF